MNESALLFNRPLVRTRQLRAAASRDTWGPVYAECAERLAERLDDITRRFPRVLVLGARHPALMTALEGRAGITEIVSTAGHPPATVVADEECLPFAERSFDAVISCMALHWANDLPGVLAQVARILKPDGLFLASLPGPQTLRELRESFLAAEAAQGGGSPHISPFVEVRDAGALLQRAGLALPVADSELLTLDYPDVFALFRELRLAGETNALLARHTRGLSRRVLAQLVEHYHATCADDEGRIPATLEIVTLTGWRPDASQAAPAKRGSGQVSLKDVL